MLSKAQGTIRSNSRPLVPGTLEWVMIISVMGSGAIPRSQLDRNDKFEMNFYAGSVICDLLLQVFSSLTRLALKTPRPPSPTSSSRPHARPSTPSNVAAPISGELGQLYARRNMQEAVAAVASTRDDGSLRKG